MIVQLCEILLIVLIFYWYHHCAVVVVSNWMWVDFVNYDCIGCSALNISVCLVGYLTELDSAVIVASPYSYSWQVLISSRCVTVQNIAAYMLRNRLVLLHHFSELFCPCIPMFDLEQKLASVGASSVSQSDLLRALLVSSAKVMRW